MMNTEDVLKKARLLDEFKNDLPEVEVGNVVNLETIWDGNAEVPEKIFSYKLTDTQSGEDWINYEFEYIDKNIFELIYNLDTTADDYDENMKMILESKIKITNIEIV